MLALLVPSRARPQQLHRMIQSAISKTTVDINIYVAISQEDLESYLPVLDNKIVKTIIVPDMLPTAHKWNLLAECAMQDKNQLFMLAADDMVFDTNLWGECLIENYNALESKAHIYALQDSRDADGTPHPIMTREYIEVMGWFVPPYFLHWFIDSWTVKIAKYNDCFTHLKDYLLVHDKPSDHGNADETHNRIREWGWHERDKWVNDKIASTVLGMDCQRLRWKVKP